MRFSTKAEYGLKAMVNLAISFPEIKNIKAIASEEEISVKYLERLMGILRENNLVNSHQGKNGGYALAKQPTYIKVGKIIEALEGPILIKCEREECRLKKCPSKKVWMKLGKQIKETLYGIKLSDLI